MERLRPSPYQEPRTGDHATVKIIAKMKFEASIPKGRDGKPKVKLDKEKRMRLSLPKEDIWKRK